MTSTETGAPPIDMFPESIRWLMGNMLEPSHRIVGDNFVVAIDCDPDVVRRFVPEPLELDDSGRVYVWTFESWVYSGRPTEGFMAPERINFAETLIYIPCDFKGERYHFVPVCWSNRDWLAIWGRQVGMPHRIATVQLTKLHAADPEYGTPSKGLQVCFSVDQLGRPVKGEMTFDEEVDETDIPFGIGRNRCPKFLGHRFMMDVAARAPVFNDLITHHGDDMTVTDVWRGMPTIEFADINGLEMSAFAPREVVGGWWFRMLYNRNSTPPTVIHRFGED